METLIYQCPNCGGGLHFDPTSQQYQCEYCASQFAPDQFQEMERQAESQTAVESELSYYQCPSCGAEVVTDETTIASFCFYCHNPVILSGKLTAEFYPDSVVPFTVNREQIMNIFDDWMKSKKYLPADFYSPQQIEKMVGVYFPYWLYDCRLEGTLKANGEIRRTWISGSTEYTEIKTFQVNREGMMDINDVSRNALKKADRELVDAVLPYDMNKTKKFSMGFLTGFFAEKRNIEKNEYQQEVQQEVREFALSSLKNSLGPYQNISIQKQDISMVKESWEYILLPVWTLTYQSRKDNKIYYFACNGQSGKVCGELPVDQKKLMRLFLSVFIPVFIVLLIAGYLI